MRLENFTFCRASVPPYRGPHAIMIAWGEDCARRRVSEANRPEWAALGPEMERSQRPSPTEGRGRQSGFRDDEGARGATAGRAGLNSNSVRPFRTYPLGI